MIAKHWRFQSAGTGDPWRNLRSVSKSMVDTMSAGIELMQVKTLQRAFHSVTLLMVRVCHCISNCRGNALQVIGNEHWPCKADSS